MRNSLKSLIGVALVSAGALFLIVSYLAGWTCSNWVLLTGLIIILLGIIMHVKLAKTDGNY